MLFRLSLSALLLLALHIASPAQVRSTIATEQDFVDYLGWLATKDSTVRHDNINAFYGSLHSDSLRANWYLTAMDYLTNADSPLRNERLFSSFLDSRFGLLADSLVATVIGDSTVGRADNDNGRTVATKATVRPRVLFVYDPDCDHCREVIAHETASPSLGPVVWAVCVTASDALWREAQSALPPQWHRQRHDPSLLDEPWLGAGSLPVVYYFP